MEKREMRKMFRRLAAWHWSPTNPYKYIIGAVGNEAALNLLWAVKGRPSFITQSHLDADFGMLRDLVREVVNGLKVEDWALLLTPDKFWKLVQAYPDVFKAQANMSYWQRALEAPISI